MAINDILLKIKEETEKKINRIKEETEKKIQELEKEWQGKILMEKNKILHQAQEKADKKIKQEEIKIKLAAKNLILTEKQKIIEDLWQEVLEELSRLEDEKYLELIVFLLSRCPAQKGTITPAAGREKITEQAIKKSHRQDELSLKNIKVRGGFIYQSEKAEINASFEELIKEMKEGINIELNKIIFA